MSMTSDIRRLQRRARGGVTSFTFDESGAVITARIFPTRGEAQEMVSETLKEKGQTSVSLDDLTRLIEAEMREPLFTAQGATMEEAVQLLGKSIAEEGTDAD